MRKQDDAEGVMSVLELCLRNNFAGIENFRLYSETFFGTKYLIENYLSEVEEALAFVSASDKVSAENKRAFYRSTQKNMGRSALCLSGGGSFGYYHIGVVRALLDANLLPNIITGTSAGGLIAALACTRTNEELKRCLVPELADRITACEEPFSVWGKRVLRTGVRFDLTQWAEKAQFFTRGSMTFAEAYARTGKTLNISVIPSDRHSPVKLLNHHTAPNCIIWSSLLASAAVPGLLKPVCLMQKTRSGHAVPWNWGHRFKDGSLRVDIPLQDLHSLFNVTYPIVSQVNPHVHLFFFAPKGMPGRPVAHRKGKGWRGGFLLSASEHVLKLNLSMNFKIIRDLDLLPSLLGQDWSSVFLQRFSGAVTIWPKTRAWDWVRILSDPDRKELYRMMCVGQGVTFPKLHMIENRVRIERALENGRRANRRLFRAEQRAAASGTIASAQGTSVEGHSANAGDSGAEGHVHTPAGGALTQSDTDGEFFVNAAAAAGTSEDNAGANGKHGDTRRHVTDLDRLRKKLNAGFSPRTGKGHDVSHARDATLTASNVALGAAAYAEGASTPGELPRHIRVRSMGLDDDDDAADSALNASATIDGSQTSTYDKQYDQLTAHLLRQRKARTAGGRSADVVQDRLAFPTSSSRTQDSDWTKRGSVRDDYTIPDDDDDDTTMRMRSKASGRHSDSSSSSSSGIEDE
jgi:predicted acylesterase/phospholipase RssA